MNGVTGRRAVGAGFKPARTDAGATLRGAGARDWRRGEVVLFDEIKGDPKWLPVICDVPDSYEPAAPRPMMLGNLRPGGLPWALGVLLIGTIGGFWIAGVVGIVEGVAGAVMGWGG